VHVAVEAPPEIKTVEFGSAFPVIVIDVPVMVWALVVMVGAAGGVASMISEQLTAEDQSPALFISSKVRVWLPSDSAEEGVYPVAEL
jgi:hypothetical protein